MDNPHHSHTPLFFMDLWQAHRFRVDLVADRAGVPEDTIYTMLRYQPVKENEAQKILATLSTLYQQEYTLSTVSVWVLERNTCGKTT
jgi:hypothetical protein